MCLTEKGKKVMGYDSAAATRHGGMEHQYWKEKVAAKLRECGYEVKEEYPIGQGKTIDLVARKDGKSIAIEIETGKSDAVANIRKCLDAGFQTVLSVATTAGVKKIVEKHVQALGNNGQEVRVLSIGELLDTDDLARDSQ